MTTTTNTETSTEMVARIGTDGALWAAEFARVAHEHGAQFPACLPAPGELIHGWFANAIEAGRSAGYAEAKREQNR